MIFLAMRTIVVQIGKSLLMEVREDRIRNQNSVKLTPYLQAVVTMIQLGPPI